jgi:hypothetical protein
VFSGVVLVLVLNFGRERKRCARVLSGVLVRFFGAGGVSGGALLPAIDYSDRARTDICTIVITLC